MLLPHQNSPLHGVAGTAIHHTSIFNFVYPRCVSDRQRSFALGIQWIVVRTLGMA